MEHFLTLAPGNYGQTAHIFAFRRGGPRGKSRHRPQDIHELNNLILLCPDCHHHIDDNAAAYPVSTLKKYKRCHEERIHTVTGLGPDYKTTIVQLKADIGKQTVAIPATQVAEAIAPYYPNDLHGYVIDLSGFHSDSRAFVQAAAERIRLEVERIYAPGMVVQETRHISLFALAPIPILVFLGSQLSNKIPVDFFQRHRDTGKWVWKSRGTPVGYKFQLRQSGSDRTKVALMLSLSGTVRLEDLPVEIDERFFVYEITLDEHLPSPTYLRLRQELDEFRAVYQTCLRIIGRDHHQLQTIHLFPAVPAPVAVACGYELLPKIDPTLFVYDNDRAKGGFTLALEVNKL
jgi:hypothetical protein